MALSLPFHPSPLVAFAHLLIILAMKCSVDHNGIDLDGMGPSGIGFVFIIQVAMVAASAPDVVN